MRRSSLILANAGNERGSKVPWFRGSKVPMFWVPRFYFSVLILSSCFRFAQRRDRSKILQRDAFGARRHVDDEGAGVELGIDLELIETRGGVDASRFFAPDPHCPRPAVQVVRIIDEPRTVIGRDDHPLSAALL